MRKKNRFKEFLMLFFLSVAVKCKNLLEFFKILFYYYPNFSFAKADFLLLLYYSFKSPFKISKQFLLKQGENNIHVYGETPITSMAKIAKECNIQVNDHVFELGMGRGRCCFWLHYFIGCKVTGIEYIKEFVNIAESVKQHLKINRLVFLQEEMLNSNFNEGSVFYLYGTCYDKAFIKELIKKFKKLPSGTKIITVSYPLSDYTNESYFKVVKKFSISFTWGHADVYLQVLT